MTKKKCLGFKAEIKSNDNDNFYNGIAVDRILGKNYSLYHLEKPNEYVKLATFNCDESVIKFKEIIELLTKGVNND